MMNLKIIIRSIVKEKLKFFLIIVGLAMGFSGFLILQLFISIELSYDTFHDDYENIYRIITKTKNTGGDQRTTLSDGGLKFHLSETFPAIKSVTHFIPIYFGIKVMSNGESLVEKNGLYVDEDFNNVFDFSIISGDSKSMFTDVNSIALTKSLAIKFFGNINIVGQTLFIGDGFGARDVKVTGIYNDVPENSSIKFDFLISSRTYPFWERVLNRTNGNYFFTYLRFENKVSKDNKIYIESNLKARNSTLNNHNNNLKKEYIF